MIVHLNTLTSALGQLSSMILDSDKKNSKPHVILDIQDDIMNICYGNGTKSFLKTIPVQTTDEDLKGKMIFDFEILKNIVDSCAPVGKIRTDEIQFINDTPGSFKIVAEKRIPTISKDPETGEKKEGTKIASVVEQRIGYIDSDAANGQLKLAALMRERYELLRHYPEEYINEKYSEGSLELATRPMTDEEWEANADVWDRKELCDLLYKLSGEKSRTMYVSKKAKIGFVQNTAYTVSIPINIEDELKHVIIFNTLISKMVADVLYKDTGDKIYIHMLDSHKIVFINEDNTLSVMATIQNSDKAQLTTFQATTAKKYNSVQFNLNRDVLISCIKGAQAVMPATQDKVNLKIEKVGGETGGEGAEAATPVSYRIVLTVANTGSSLENRYEIEPEYSVINMENAEITLPIFMKVIVDAITRIKEDFVAFDIEVSGGAKNNVRIAGIDTDKISELKAKTKEETGKWDDEDRSNNRTKYITTATYFAS